MKRVISLRKSDVEAMKKLGITPTELVRAVSFEPGCLVRDRTFMAAVERVREQEKKRLEAKELRARLKKVSAERQTDLSEALKESLKEDK